MKTALLYILCIFYSIPAFSQGAHLWQKPGELPQVFVNPDESLVGVFTNDHLTLYDTKSGKRIYTGNFIYDDVLKFRESVEVTSFSKDFKTILIMNDGRTTFWGLNTKDNKWQTPRDWNKKHWYLDTNSEDLSIQIDKKAKELYKTQNGKRVVLAKPVTNGKNHFVAGSGRYSVFTKDNDSRILIYDHFTDKRSKFPEKNFVLDKALMESHQGQLYVFGRNKKELAIYDLSTKKLIKKPYANTEQTINGVYSNCNPNKSKSVFQGGNSYYAIEVDESLLAQRPDGRNEIPYKLVQYNRNTCEKVREINFSNSAEKFNEKITKIDQALAALEAEKQAKKQKELERMASKKAPVFKMLGQNIYENYWRVNPTGRYIAFSRKEAEQVAIWDLKTLKQVYNYIKPKSKGRIGYWNFDYDADTGNMLYVGYQQGLQAGVYSMIDKNETYDGSTSIPNDRGLIDIVTDREAGMVITNFEKDKKGRLKTNKPKWSQIQLYNVDTKKWRTKRFPKAKNIELITAQNIVAIIYAKHIEFFKYKDLSLNSLQKIGEVKTDCQSLRFNYEEKDIVYLVETNKNGHPQKAIRYNLKTGKTNKVDEKIAHSYFRRNRVGQFIPKLETVDVDGYQAVKLTVKNLETGESSSTFITPTSKTEENEIRKKIQDFHNNDVDAQVELANKKLKAAQRQKDVDYFFSNFEFIGTGKSYNLVNLRGRNINSLPIANEILGQTWGQKSAVGKIMDCGGSYILFYVINGRNNTDVRLAQVSKSGGFIRKTNLVSVPVVNGQLAADLQFTFFKSGKGVRFDYTKLDLRTGKKTSKQIKCPCNSSWQ